MNLREVVEKYFDGEKIKTVEMGGIDEEYEGAIQELAFVSMQEIIGLMDDIVDKNVKNIDWEFSGAQVGAAKNMVHVFMLNGYEKGLDLAGEDRIIEIKK